MQCVARGTEGICTYEKSKSSPGSSHLSSSSPSETTTQLEDREAPALLRHAHDYGYSNSDSLNSLGMLTKVITGIDADISSSQPVAASQIQSRIRSEYYGYVRRLPSKIHCEVLFQHFFVCVNHLNAALDETIFREQVERWWSLAYDLLLKQGPEKLPEDLQCFPALIFQVLALALQFLPLSYDARLDELRFGPSQTFTDLSREYSDCSVALSKLVGRMRLTLVGVQQSFLRDCWLVNTGDLMQAWNHSGLTVKNAMAIGLHLEPEMPLSSQPEALLNALWMNELRKRTWLNLFAWDSCMAVALGRPMFIDLKACTVTVPMDCDIPKDRLKRVPIARSDSDKPTPMTERLLRSKMSQHFYEIRELELEGPIPREPDKVKELHNFAVNFRKSLPAFYQISNPDTRWDVECPFVPTHRELLSYMVDSFFMTLHRPYIFTREKSQRQVYESSLAILDSQDRLFGVLRGSQMQFYIGLAFPTFDAAVLLAVVLVSNPERYQTSFSRPYQSLRNAFERLQFIGSSMALAKTGAEILQATICRVKEAQERAGFTAHNPFGDSSPAQAYIPPMPEELQRDSSDVSTSMSPDADSWRFEVSQSAMDWTTQNHEFSEFDFSNLEVPMPLKELLLDEEVAAMPDVDIYNSGVWMPTQEQQTMTDFSENSLWNFLTRYPITNDDQTV